MIELIGLALTLVVLVVALPTFRLAGHVERRYQRHVSQRPPSVSHDETTARTGDPRVP